jgi:hypothetical protein
MTPNERTHPLVSWLHDQEATPGYLDEILVRSKRQRQRPAWTFLERWIPMQLTMRRAFVPRQLAYLVLLALLAVAIAITALVVGTQRRTVSPFGLAANGVVAFDRDGAIVVANADGSGASEIVTSIADARGPVFSPDGSRLTFYGTVGGKTAILVARANGSDVVVVSAGIDLDRVALESAPSWSPDGSQLVFAASDGLVHRLYVARADGSDVRPIGGADLSRIDPAWAPSGDWIAFHGFRVADQAAAGDYRTVAGLFVMRPDGSNERQLTSDDGGDFIFRKPQWQPDPTRSVLAYAVGEPGQYDIATFDLATNSQTVIAKLPSADVWPKWSPDGSLLAWNGSAGIKVSRPDGTIVHDRPGRLDYDFVWSPDGTSLYGWKDEARTAIHIIRIDGSADPVVIATNGDSRSHWSWQRTAP